MKALFNEEKLHRDKDAKKNKIDFGFQAKQISDIESPFAKFPMPNLKTISVNAGERVESIPAMNANYRPQRKQYSPKEVKKYMTSTIDLSQPDFTYCEIKDIGKHSEYVRMQQAYESDKRFGEKYAQLVRKTLKEKEMKNRKQKDEALLSNTESKQILLRNSMYILPHLKDSQVKYFLLNFVNLLHSTLFLILAIDYLFTITRFVAINQTDCACRLAIRSIKGARKLHRFHRFCLPFKRLSAGATVLR